MNFNHLSVNKMQVPIIENPAPAYLYNPEELGDYEPNPSRGLPAKYASMGFAKGWKAYKKAKIARKNPKRKTKRKATKRKYRKNYGTKAGARKLGKAHYRRIGKLGAKARWAKNPKRNVGTTKGGRKAWVTRRRRYGALGRKKYTRNYGTSAGAKKAWRTRRKYKKNPNFNFSKEVGILRPAGLKVYKKKPITHLGITAIGLIDISLIGIGLDYGFKKVKQLEGEYRRDIARIVSKLLIGTIISWGIAKITKKPLYGKLHQTGVYIAVGLDIIGTILKVVAKNKITTILPAFKGAELGFMPIPKETFFEIFGFGQVRRAYLLGKISKAIEAGHEVGVVRNHTYSGIRNFTTGEMLIKGTVDGIQNFAGILFETDAFGENISVEEGLKGFSLQK